VPEALQQTVAYIETNLAASLVMAVIAGFLATRLVAAERRPGVIGFTIIGSIGFFLGHFVINYYQLSEYLDSLQGLRIVIDLIAAFIGSFVIAGLVHFIKPT
jgi:uncharacterized membrane protein YeaQ/YmgE (transglycosylase-associated protein family)